jgi:hypothetical protein
MNRADEATRSCLSCPAGMIVALAPDRRAISRTRHSLVRLCARPSPAEGRNTSPTWIQTLWLPKEHLWRTACGEMNRSQEASDELRRTDVPSDDAIHEARKRVKRARALLRVIDADHGQGLRRKSSVYARGMKHSWKAWRQEAGPSAARRTQRLLTREPASIPAQTIAGAAAPCGVWLRR